MDKPDYGKVPEYLKAAKLKLQHDKEAKLEAERKQVQQVCSFNANDQKRYLSALQV